MSKTEQTTAAECQCQGCQASDTPEPAKPPDGGPAFPTNAINNSGFEGMSLRMWFAGMALSGQWQGRYPMDLTKPSTVSLVAEKCCELADAMLAELAKGGER